MFFTHLRAILVQSLKVEWSNSERWLSPLLFAITMLVLFSFAIGNIEPEFAVKIFVAETFLTALFALQISFSRILDPDTQDRVFDLLRTYPIQPAAWFIAKYLLVLVMGALIVFPTMLLATFFLGSTGVDVLQAPVFLVAFAAISCLASVGVLLSTMTMRSGSKQILYPLLYFPLTTPVLLSAVEASTAVITSNRSFSELLESWLGLLLIFGIIYFTLGVLLYGELVKAE